jgi:branched-chain amino acid transport system permease protein
MSWSAIISNALYAAIGVNAIGYALAAMGLNIHFGYTGLLNFGQAGFCLLGAYAVAIPVGIHDWSLWAALPLVPVVAAIFALMLGVPTLRLRSDYLAIVTIAAAEILRLIVSTPRWTGQLGGTDGITKFTDDFRSTIPFEKAQFFLWKAKMSNYDLWAIICGWVIIAIVALLLWALIRSPWGRVLRSIREDEDAARSLGKNVFAYKMISLVLGGVLGAIGGVVLAVGNQNANPTTFQTQATFFAYAILVLGGVGKVVGPVIGSVIFWFIISFTDNLLSQLTDDKGWKLPEWFISANNYSFTRWLLIGLGLVLLVIFRPQGILGNREEQAFDVK